MYDGEDPEKFEPWLSKLESACLVGKRDVREVAICSSTGPVLEVLNSIEDEEDWATHRDELHHCFSTNKTRVHAADLLSNFRCQHANENLRSFIHQYTKMHRQATGLKSENDYDLSRKVEFMKRIRNTQIANKIIKSNHFKDYTKYSLQACFTRALELEGDFQVGEVVTPNYVQAKCTVSLSVFAGPERILRRFSIFAEEPCKSTITTTEPCSPVFKEAQPRPSSAIHSV